MRKLKFSTTEVEKIHKSLTLINLNWTGLLKCREIKDRLFHNPRLTLINPYIFINPSCFLVSFSKSLIIHEYINQSIRRSEWHHVAWANLKYHGSSGQRTWIVFFSPWPGEKKPVKKERLELIIGLEIIDLVLIVGFKYYINNMS